MTTEKQPYGTVLIKASKIVDFLSESKNPQPLNMIAKETEMTSPTTLKILDTLVLIGYVKKDSDTKKFSLGPALIRYANQYLANLDLIKISYPYLKHLQDQFDETVHLGMLEGDKVMYVNKLETKKTITCTNSRIGISTPLYSSAMGKSLLAEYRGSDLKTYLDQIELRSFTSNTITDKDVLMKEVIEAQKKGYAFDDEENENEVFCIGSSLVLDGEIYGAFSISVPKYRITEESKKEFAREVLETKKNILAELQQMKNFM